MSLTYQTQVDRYSTTLSLREGINVNKVGLVILGNDVNVNKVGLVYLGNYPCINTLPLVNKHIKRIFFRIYFHTNITFPVWFQGLKEKKRKKLQNRRWKQNLAIHFEVDVLRLGFWFGFSGCFFIDAIVHQCRHFLKLKFLNQNSREGRNKAKLCVVLFYCVLFFPFIWSVGLSRNVCWRYVTCRVFICSFLGFFGFPTCFLGLLRENIFLWTFLPSSTLSSLSCFVSFISIYSIWGLY